MGTNLASHDSWSNTGLYEQYVGRWSRLVAREFVRWLAIPEAHEWLDVGCGTGALSQLVLETMNPKRVKGIDRSEEFIRAARRKFDQPRIEFETADAQALPEALKSYDAAISGLVLNFVPQPSQMISEMIRAVRTKGTVALYVWDYAGKMQMMRHFWNAAAALDPDARDRDEGRRFPLCSPGALIELFQHAGLRGVEVRPIDIDTHFKDFDDYWIPFLSGQAPAPGYAMSRTEEQRAQLRERIYNSLPFAVDGSIPLVARAWAVKGVKLD